jgi:aspartate/methionine/tyrosine aminotransferase
VVPVGIAQDAVAVALERSASTMSSYIYELCARRDAVIQQLEGLPVGVPDGGWSLLMRVSDYGIDGETMAEQRLDDGVCATAMKGWGVEHGSQYIRFVFANEPIERLMSLGNRVRSALGI